ncbi:MAG: hypothetical protein NTW72_02725 [Gemmatimonadetes bacterium]|nr:hypothetical protein [Gemmatimonadota bacterium]
MRHFRVPHFSLLAAPVAILSCAVVASAQVTVQPRASTAAALNIATLAIKPMPYNMAAFNARLSAAVKPTVRGWVQSEARALAGRKLSPDAMLATARGDVLGRFSGQTLASADVETMAMLVMTECAKEAQAELEALLAQMNATNAARRAQRQAAMTYEQAAAAKRATADSLSDLTAGEMFVLQQVMDKKSQLEQMISNVMKSGADAASAAIVNLK